MKLSQLLHGKRYFTSDPEDYILIDENNNIIIGFIKTWDNVFKCLFKCPICNKETIVLYFESRSVKDCNLKPIKPNVVSICESCLEHPEKWMFVGDSK